MDLDRLIEWKRAVQAEIQEITIKVQSLNAELQKKVQQIDLISRLVDSEGGALAPSNETTLTPAGTLRAWQVVTPDQVKDRVCEILSEAKRPMNIKEIHAVFMQRGYPIPGKGTHFNILVHIVRELKKGKNARFKRDGRGTYSLRSGQGEKERK